MRIPSRRVRPKMRVRQSSLIRCPAHLRWVRSHRCVIEGIETVANTPRNGLGYHVNQHVCGGIIEAMHVRTGTDGSTGEKPSDCWTIPGCTVAHREQHSIGERAFERKYRIDMKALAAEMWRVSPAGVKWRKENDK